MNTAHKPLSRFSRPHPSTRRSPPYFLLFIFFITLSIVIFILYQKSNQQLSTQLVLENTRFLPTTIPEPTLVPTSVPGFFPTVIIFPTQIPPSPTIQPTLSPLPTPVFRQYQSLSAKFKLSYKSYRQVTQETESNITRYVFYSPKGTFTVHTGSSWAWINTERVITPYFLVDSQETYVYTDSTQKLVDFQKNGIYYTLQCVHNGNSSLIAECDQFIRDFKFL